MTKSPHPALHHAFDEARFGFARTLDLRASLPTGAEATRRADAWLRERQVAKAGAVLIITGRGNNSTDGVPVVRNAIRRLLTSLKRKGVVAGVREHTPGSYEVELAPFRAIFEAPRRTRDHSPALRRNPAAFAALDGATQGALRQLAERSLDTLGAPRSEQFVHDEMARQFALLSNAIATDETDRESRLRFLIESAQHAFDEQD
jgi:hypothetical protein